MLPSADLPGADHAAADASAAIPGADFVADDARALFSADRDLYEAVCRAVNMMREAFDNSPVDVETVFDMEHRSETAVRIVVTAYSREPSPVAELRKVQQAWGDSGGGDSLEFSVQAAA